MSVAVFSTLSILNSFSYLLSPLALVSRNCRTGSVYFEINKIHRNHSAIVCVKIIYTHISREDLLSIKIKMGIKRAFWNRWTLGLDLDLDLGPGNAGLW